MTKQTRTKVPKEVTRIRNVATGEVKLKGEAIFTQDKETVKTDESGNVIEWINQAANSQ